MIRKCMFAALPSRSRHKTKMTRDRFLFFLFLFLIPSLYRRCRRMCRTIVFGCKRATSTTTTSRSSSSNGSKSQREAACHLKSVGAEAIELDIVFHQKRMATATFERSRNNAIHFGSSFGNLFLCIPWYESRVVALSHSHF